MKTKRVKQLMRIVGVTTVLGVLVGCARGDFTFPQTLTPISIPAGRSGTVKITVTRTGGFAGEISFTITGLPTGVSYKFDPVKTTATGVDTTLTLTVDTGVPAEKYPLKVVAESGKLRKEAILELSVLVAPDYSFEPMPTPITIKQGAMDTVTINLKRTDTFKEDPVILTLEGAPAGVTGTFSPASVAGATSTLTITVAREAAPGTYSLTVRGKATGLPDKAATVWLTVEALPDFSLALSPTAVSVKLGESGRVTITLSRVGGFDDPVLFEVEGLHAGVTARVDPNPAPAGSATLTLVVSDTAAAGSYSLKVRGTGGGISKVALLKLTIVP